MFLLMLVNVSGLNGTHKTPTYKMPLTFVFGVLGLGGAFLYYVWAMIFCHWHFVFSSLDKCMRLVLTKIAIDLTLHMHQYFS